MGRSMVSGGMMGDSGMMGHHGGMMGGVGGMMMGMMVHMGLPWIVMLDRDARPLA